MLRGGGAAAFLTKLDNCTISAKGYPEFLL